MHSTAAHATWSALTEAVYAGTLETTAAVVEAAEAFIVEAAISGPDAVIVTAETVAAMEAVEAFAPEVIMIAEMMIIEMMEAIVMERYRVEAVESVMKTEATIEVKRTVERWMYVVEVVPGARADKHAAHKPVGAVITVRRAGKGIRWIETVGADWRGIVNAVTWADLNADGNLRLRIRHRQNQQSQ